MSQQIPNLAAGLKHNPTNVPNIQQFQVPQTAPQAVAPTPAPAPVPSQVPALVPVAGTEETMTILGMVLQKKYVYIIGFLIVAAVLYFAWNYYNKNKQEDKEEDYDDDDDELPFNPNMMNFNPMMEQFQQRGNPPPSKMGDIMRRNEPEGGELDDDVIQDV